MFKNIFKSEVGEEAINQAKKAHAQACLDMAVKTYDLLFEELNREFERGESMDKGRIYQILKLRSQIVRLVCLPVDDAKLLAVVDEARKYLESK
jgi:hypothetical protein